MPVTRNQSKQDSPTKEATLELASSSGGSIKDMLAMLLEKVDGVDKRMDEMQGNINAMQGDFTMLHEDMALLRGQAEHPHSIPSNNRTGTGSKADGSPRRGDSEAAYSNHQSEYGYNNEADWQEEERRYFNDHGRGGGRPFVGGHGPNGGRGNFERYNRNRYYGWRGEAQYDDPARNFKHTIPEFHGKFEPDTYLEWESQVDKIFSLHNYSEGDKVKLVIAEFRGYANTWWSDLMRKRRATRKGGVRSWVELNDLMRATFVPKSYFHKLRGDLQDLKQDNKSVMEYYYELIALRGRVGLEESEDATQDRFIHGLNVHL